MRKIIITSVLAILGLWSVFTVAAPDRIVFAIESQPLRAALQAFAKQTGMQVLRRDEDVPVEGVVAPRVQGELSAREALDLLLGNTEFTYEFINDRTVRVIAPKSERDAVSSVQGMTQLAQTDQSNDTAPTQQDREARTSNSVSKQSEVNEIVVTAQKREERLQDVPISLSVLGGEQLDRSFSGGALEALRRVPGVTIDESFIGSGAQIPVRGVGASSTLGAGSSPTAIYLDSVPFGFVAHATGPDPDVYDLERIEVLRGPQGTLYGANALNGVVRILTKDANPDAFELKARASTSYTEDGGANYRGDAAINIPIIDGKLAARAVLGYQDVSGWVDRPNKEDANDSERGNLRFKINARPTEQLSIDASAWLSRIDTGGLPNASDADRQSPSVYDEFNSTDYDVYGLTIDYELSRLSISSKTSYIDYSNRSDIALPGSFVPPFPRVTQQRALTAETFAQEVNLSSSTQGSWRWSAGAIYRESQDRNAVLIAATFLAPSTVQNTSKSRAVFGELTRLFLDGQFAVTAGLRHFEDDVDLQELSRNNAAPQSNLISANSEFDSTTPRLVLTWKPTERLTSYASYSEGFRSGAAQDPAVLQLDSSLPPVKPDTLRNYEVGAKGNLLDGRLNFDTAVFYTDWQDVQLFYAILSPLGRSVFARVNSESASGLGFEFSVTAKPMDPLELGFSFGKNDLKVDADVMGANAVVFQEGERLNVSPEYTAGAWADYMFPLAATGLNGRLSASVNYTSEIAGRDAVGGRVFSPAGDSILMGRASFAVESRAWTATLFVDNATDEDGAYSPVLFVPSWSSHPRPRTIGFQVEYNY